MGAEGQPLVIKTDKGDWLVDLIPREFEIHSYLTLEGCESVPPLDETLSNESQLVMPLIDSAATLEDYLLDVATGELSIEVAIDILEAVRIALEDFYSYGIIHGDLHCRNILIGLQDGGWRAYIIDVGLSVLLNWEVHPEWAGWHDPEEWSHWMCGAYYPSLEGDWSKLIPPIQNILSDISEPALRAQLSHLEEVFE
jgi:serine/threonine protein kinase